MDQEFSDFGKFRKSDKSMKHALGSISAVCVLLALWCLTQEVAGLKNLSKI